MARCDRRLFVAAVVALYTMDTCATATHTPQRRLDAVLEAPVPITYMSYSQIVDRMRALASLAPNFVRMWNAQDTYGLQSPGQCGTDTNGHAVACKHWFLTLSNFAANATVLTTRPHVFLSGNLHGDEEVGPMTLIYVLEYLIRTRLTGANAWVNRLVDERYTIAIPMTNPIG